MKEADISNTNMNQPNYDPYDPDSKLPAIAKEFATRPDHGQETDRSWQPGDPMMTPAQLAASWEYARKTVEQKTRDDIKAREELLAEAEITKRLRWRKIVGRSVAAVACSSSLYGVAAPGIGIADRMTSAPAAEVVHSAVANREMDEKAMDAYTTVLKIYEDIDQNGFDIVQKRAATERAEHSEEYISPEAIDTTREQIENAAGYEDVEVELGNFLHEFGIQSVNIDHNIRLRHVKSSAQAVLNVFGGLPKSLVKESASVNRLNLVPGSNAREGNVTEGNFKKLTGAAKGEMNIMTDGSQFSLSNQAVEALSGMAGSREYIVAHELAHALQEKNGINLDDKTKVDQTAWLPKDIIMSHLDMPERPTDYGSNTVEPQAEIMAGLLTNDDTGLKPPSHSRHFASVLGKKQINELVTLEQWHPGIALQLIAARK